MVVHVYCNELVIEKGMPVKYEDTIKHRGQDITGHNTNMCLFWIYLNVNVTYS